MELPLELRTAIEKQTEGMNVSEMKRISEELSHRYREKSGRGKVLLADKAEAAVYSAVRMPATFGAVFSALNYVLETVHLKAATLLDVGAGTGAATWAADALLKLDTVTCLEREEAMRVVGKSMMQYGTPVLKEAKWISGDLISDDILQADLIIASYVLNELLGENFLGVLDKLWQAAGELLLIVEPGTPQGHKRLRMAREYLISKGADIAAPCPHNTECPMTWGLDWCHSTCRIPRSRLHRLLKEGEVPYEDEKFSYMAFVKEQTKKVPARILRHPYMGNGYVSLEVCGTAGIEKVVARKKEKDFYKKARKAKCGDSIELPKRE